MSVLEISIKLNPGVFQEYEYTEDRKDEMFMRYGDENL